jgi:hypothetical protein
LFAGVEQASVHGLHGDEPEIVGRDDIQPRGRTVVVMGKDGAFGRHLAGDSRTDEIAACHGHRLDAGLGLQALEQGAVEPRPRLGRRMGALLDFDPAGEKPVRLIAKVGLADLIDGQCQDTGGDKQHD